MRSARPAMLLGIALLLLAPALAAAQAASLDVVLAPRFTPGDRWSYRITYLGANNTTLSQNQTTTVLDLVTLDGVPAARTLTLSVQDFDAPGAPPLGGTHNHDEQRKTIWLDEAQRVLRIEDRSTQVQSNRAFTVITNTSLDWVMHQPMDAWAFPLLRGDAWIVPTNATVFRNATYTTSAGNNTTVTSQPTQVQNVTQVGGAQWLRTDTCGRANNCTTAGTFGVVVVQRRDGNATLFDFYSPEVGNLVRREVYDERGRLVQTLYLTGYVYQQAPAPPPPAPPDARPLLVAASAGIGVLLGLAGVLAWRRRQRRAPPQEPGSGA